MQPVKRTEKEVGKRELSRAEERRRLASYQATIGLECFGRSYWGRRTENRSTQHTGKNKSCCTQGSHTTWEYQTWSSWFGCLTREHIAKPTAPAMNVQLTSAYSLCEFRFGRCSACTTGKVFKNSFSCWRCEEIVRPSKNNVDPMGGSCDSVEHSEKRRGPKTHAALLSKMFW